MQDHAELGHEGSGAIRGLSVTVEIPGGETSPGPEPTHAPAPAPSPGATPSPSPDPETVSAPGAPPDPGAHPAPDASVPDAILTPVPSVAVPLPPESPALPRTGTELAGWLLVVVLLLVLGVALVRSTSRQGART